MMNIRKILMVGFIIIVFLSATGNPFGAGENETMVYTQNKTVSEQTTESFGEEKTFTIPEEPLDFVTTVKWEIKVDSKIAFSTVAKPFAKIFIVDVKGKSKEEVVVNAGNTKKGSIQLHPGQFCRVQLNSGQYKGLFGKRYGGVVKATCEYQLIKVTATELDAVGKFNFTVEGPKNTRWVWNFPGNSKMYGNTIQNTFQPGTIPVSLDDEEQYRHFDFQMTVPDALEINPQLSSTSGYEEFTVKGTSGVKSHYRSYSECRWSYGDGSPDTSGPNFEHTYRRSGTYNLSLAVRNSFGQTIDKNWQITVMPFNIINNDVSIYPEKGSTPLRVYFSAKPKVFGQPSLLRYLWDFGDGTTAQTISGEHVYSKKGDYKITFSVKDDFHPNFYVAPWTGTVTVLPPFITVKAQGAPAKGIIPLQVRFTSELKIEGGPTDIEYRWDFGDDNYSNVPNPTHIFTEPGRYKVVLTVWDRRNETSFTSSTMVYVQTPLVTSRSSLEPLSGPAPLQVRGIGFPEVDGHPVDLSYAWYVDGRLVANIKNLEYNFPNPGVYKVTLLIHDTLPGHTARAAHTWQVTVNNPGSSNYQSTPSPVPPSTPTPTHPRKDRDKRNNGRPD